ncbi:MULTISPECIES: hypothetical protein [Streptomyces]|uniref:Histidine kinase n=1 Tax=Streptomyces spororaveus TaxID=284039 RepID=A0ABQ3TLT5_9ACTN|nr:MULTISPECIES: hypothetical protein [Streptomyces]MCM9078301.1 hypothetical protein [Streptomyces spororaveus]MCX5307282.1 hypothetical protein [Streptomyces sp. NBC_00160]GHI81384.1 hypothetical protein Sspor_69450 [Streptomyces spororaveus]
MGGAIVLLTVGPAVLLAGSWVALNIRGSAGALERRAAAAAELAMHARGDLGPARRVASAAFYRFAGSVLALCGIVLTLGGLLELA